MAILKIYEPPAPVLRKVATPVTAVTDEIRTLMDDMLETMYDAPGIGLAAPQIGVSKRVIVMDIAPKGEAPNPMRFINPEIIWTSEETSVCQEGCLSVPESFADVVRPAEVKVRFLDAQGVEQEMHADGLLATCIQHEIDHLNGVLFIDHLSSLKRDMILRRLKKSQKERV